MGSNPVGLGDFRAFYLVGYATLKQALLVEGNFTDFLQKRNYDEEKSLFFSSVWGNALWGNCEHISIPFVSGTT